ncbi:amidohydrolase [Streptomyces sulfonofaciens]|uniref:Amidohydrolase n=1 Tax=Streptomyces sulfonofaciens TaxID=68272 RepID=A0A919KUU2_9ACTN|nr:carbon-nitrogen hydrolase family protein [Streptomyces sulfonofaciens]GHH73287.1 amidohydrolase [Streptomyces sulfonofaciens]
MAKRIRVAVAQSPVGCDPAANGEAIRGLMVAAGEAGARLVQFPEGAVSGYPSGADAKRVLAGWPVDWDLVRRESERVAALAAELGLWVVMGGNHRLTPPNRPHNSLYVISDEGRLVGRYDKRLCSFTEITDWYSPGFEPLTFEVDGFRFGCTLCIEVNFPELFLEYRGLGVDCVLLSTFSEDPVFDVLAGGHAAAHNYFIGVSVPSRCSAAMPSGVVGPHGSWLTRCPADGTAGLTWADLDRRDPRFAYALDMCRPWRTRARAGDLYEARRVTGDPRSTDRMRF